MWNNALENLISIAFSQNIVAFKMKQCFVFVVRVVFYDSRTGYDYVVLTQ